MSNQSSASGDVCPICIEPVRCDDDDRRVLDACGHPYHDECLSGWEATQRSDRRSFRCPMCNDVYKTPSDPPSLCGDSPRGSASCSRHVVVVSALAVAVLAGTVVIRGLSGWW